MTAVTALVVLPVLIFGVPALFGHAVLPGDDLTQNYPLRVLVGRDIAAGRLPLFDPYIWSGSALLAGWNAGAAYPLTLLFAVLPGVAAWSVGLVLTFVVACVGLFAFLRALRLGSVAAFLGAMSFGLAGAMSAQVTHFGLVAGMSWVPLALLGVLKLTPERDAGDSGAGDSRSGVSAGWKTRAGWTALLGTSTGLIILAGEPRAIVDGYTVVALYAIWRLVRLGWRVPGSLRACLRCCLGVGGGLALGLALGAVQWLPGMAAISDSQRGDGSLALFSSGSLPDRWLLLTLVPDLLGGSGSLSQPSFFATYNLTEVTSYVGILPLVAACALLARVRLRSRPPEWLIWHVTAVIGVLFTLGTNTPVGALLYRLPLYGGQRLQSRNILVLDLALAVLLAHWADRPSPAREPALRSVRGPVPGPALEPVRGVVSRIFRRRRVSVETLLALLPPLAVLLIVTLGLTWGAGFLRWLGGGANSDLAGRLQPWLLPYAVMAVGAGTLVILGRRLRPRVWRRACAAFVASDIVVFSVLAIVSIAPSDGAGAGVSASPAASTVSAVSGTPAASRTSGASVAARVSIADPVTQSAPKPVSDLGYTGRFAIYDPNLLDTSELSVLGPPDVNDMTVNGMASVQGYTSLVNNDYATETGAHDATGEGQNTLSPVAVANGTLDQLDTSILLTLPAYLTTSGPSASGGVAAGPAGTGRRAVKPGKRTTWYLGESVAVSQVQVRDPDAKAAAAAGTKIGLTTPGGTTQWFRARAAGAATLEVSLPTPVTSTTVVGQAGHAAVTLGAPSVVENGGQVLVADGQLQDALVPPRWNLAGFDGDFAVFTDKLASGPLTVQALPGRSAADASVRYLSSSSGDPVRATVSSADGVRLVRSVAAIPGWTAVWQPTGGTPVTLPVRADGLVQAVDVPAGRGTVTWHYTAPRFTAGLALTLGATAFVVLFTALALAGDRVRSAAWLLRPGQWGWPWTRRRRIRSVVPEVVWVDYSGKSSRPPQPAHEDQNAQV
ncbi:MAG TPA: hypothetical protein VK817_16640 [Trebonia sp.]|nr:hypothetical protein [Trebonia sp.]